jgi:hypothetical protein
MRASRYTIQQQTLEPEERLRLFRELIRWAAPRSRRFLLSAYLPHYDDPEQIRRISGLGEVIDDSTFHRMRKTVNPHPSGDELLRVTGLPDEKFVRELLDLSPPPGAPIDDISPVEDLWLLNDDRALYILEDYGRDHVVDIEALDNEPELRELLMSVGLDAESLSAHAR